jgi:putative addiction module component (TIGR02574 family)
MQDPVPQEFAVMSISDQELARLSPQERLILIEQLWDSLDDRDVPVTTAQEAEIERRLAHFSHDSAGAVTWEELKADLGKRALYAATLARMC